MSGDNEPLIPRRDDPIFPLTDRRTPILDRIRDRRKNSNIGAQVAAKVASLALFSNDEERIEEAEQIRDSFIQTLSDELGVPRDAINPEFANEFTAMFVSVEETDIVVEELIEPEDSSEEDSEEQDEEEETTFG